ncbi:MAG TPA: hypothetical protein DCL76_02480 [Chloroflexi bacterium]|nr:hypothetical protein [Chloroflexota bacterium]
MIDMPKVINNAVNSEKNVWMPIKDSWAEICATPDVIRKELQSQESVIEEIVADLRKREVRNILLLGSGDSWFASMASCYSFEKYAGLSAVPMQAYEFAVYGSNIANEESVIVVISSSGRPTTTWDALDRAIDSGAYVIGISDTFYEGNPFLERPNKSINPSATKFGMPTQTTTVTMSLLTKLALVLGKDNSEIDGKMYLELMDSLFVIPDQLIELLSNCEDALSSAGEYGSLHRLHTIIGSGPNVGVAYAASALLAEGPQFTGHPLPVEEYHHALRGCTVLSGDPVLLLAPYGKGYQRVVEACDDLKTLGAYIVAVVNDNENSIADLADSVVYVPEVDEPMSSLLTLPTVQMYSLYLASNRIASGYERPLVE